MTKKVIDALADEAVNLYSTQNEYVDAAAFRVGFLTGFQTAKLLVFHKLKTNNLIEIPKKLAKEIEKLGDEPLPKLKENDRSNLN